MQTAVTPPHHIYKVPMVEPFAILNSQRQGQSHREVQSDCAPPGLPQHEREEGELENEGVRKDDENSHCIIGQIEGKEGSTRERLTKGKIWGSKHIKNG